MKQALVDFREKLLASAPVAAVVVRRMYPNYFPEGTPFPALTYAETSAIRLSSFDGPVGFTSSRVTVGAWADGYAEARDLADKVRVAVNGFRGLFGATFFQAIKLESEIDTFGEGSDQDASSPGVHRVVLDFTVSFNET
jgi:hypothetical protein